MPQMLFLCLPQSHSSFLLHLQTHPLCPAEMPPSNTHLPSVLCLFMTRSASLLLPGSPLKAPTPEHSQGLVCALSCPTNPRVRRPGGGTAPCCHVLLCGSGHLTVCPLSSLFAVTYDLTVVSAHSLKTLAPAQSSFLPSVLLSSQRLQQTCGIPTQHHGRSRSCTSTSQAVLSSSISTSNSHTLTLVIPNCSISKIHTDYGHNLLSVQPDSSTMPIRTSL